MATNPQEANEVEPHENVSSGEEDVDDVPQELTEEQKRVAEAMGQEHVEKVVKQSRSEKKVGVFLCFQSKQLSNRTYSKI